MMPKRPIFSLVTLLIACWAVSEAQAATYTLTVTADHGSVRVNPEKVQYDEGETVELIPRLDVGYSFGHWSGDLRGRRLVGRVTMDSNKSVTATFAAWTPPIGIPTPEFGIFETYRMYDTEGNRNGDLTYREDGSGGYYTHYIDNTHVSATNTNNDYGTMDKPRTSVPNPLPAGSVVLVAGGPYSSGTGSVFVKGYGTVHLPIFVRGEPNDVPYFSTKLRVEGTHLIVEDVNAVGCNIMGEYQGDERSTEYVCVRNCELYSTNQGAGGFFFGQYSASDSVGIDNVVAYANTVHDFGDVNSVEDQDFGGALIGSRATRVWLVDNTLHEFSGSGVQVLPANSTAGQTAQYIYVGRNHIYRARQSGVWAKYGRDIVFSQNLIHDIIHTSWSPSKAMGFQYGPQNVWYLFNEIHSCAMGFYGPGVDGGTDIYAYVIGNLIYDLVLPDGYSFNPNDAYCFAAVTWYGTAHRNIVANTFHNVPAGVHGSADTGEYLIAGNIFSEMTEGKHVFIDSSTAAGNSALEYNLFHQTAGSVVVEWGNVVTGDMAALRSQTSTGDGCIVADPGFPDANSSDSPLLSDSTAVDAGSDSGVLKDACDQYYTLYGIDIRKDIAGRPRPAGGGWDIGAYEYVLEAVEDLAGSGASRNSVTLNWTIPGIDGSSDRPGRYDIRYAQSPLTEANWDAATQVQGEPAPGDVGDSQSFTVTGLDSGTMYYIGIKTSNTAVSTISDLSNVVSMATAAGGNHAPVLTPIGDKAVAENTTLAFTVSATDADSDALTYSASGLPSGAAFNTATRAFSWTPTNTQSGVYWVTFGVTDGQVAISETVEITVAEIVNNAPVLAAIGNKSVSENALLSFSVSATDADGHSLTYSATGLPTGANFTGQTFTWVPTYDQSGSYTVTFTVSDGELTDSEQITIAVANVTPDLADPTASANYPAADAIQVPVNPVIGLTVSDAGGGVDANTVTIRVNDQLVYSGNTASHQSAYGVCRRTGAQASYRYYYQPAEPFRFDEQVSVRVTASDLAGNAMTPYTYSFTTEMRVFGDNRPASWAPDDLDKSRPATVRDSAGNIWLAYHAGPAGQRNIYLSKLTPGSDSFGGPVQLTANGSDQCYPAIGIGADDRLYVVWQDYRRGNWDIYLRTSADGVTWSAETRITDSDDHQTRAAIAVDGQSPNQVHVAWQDDGAGNQDIQIATSSNLFATKTISQVTTNASDQTAPAIAVNASNTVFLVWTDARNGTSDVYGAASNSGPWTNVPIATGAGSQSSPAIAAEATGTGLHFAWEDSASGDSDIRYASSNGMPASLLVGVNVADDTSGADQTAPTITAAGSAGDGLRVFVCWVDDRNVNVDGRDTDLYFVEVSAGQGTNILVGDGGTGSDQSEPVLGVDVYGYPYVLWTDHRNVTKYVYYAGSTFMAPSLVASEAVTASAGGTVGAASPVSEGDASVVIPAAACPHDVTITISRILNPQSILSSNVVAFDFGPSGIQFSQPVTLTIPYAAADYSGGTPVPCWYVSQTGTLSQEGISNIQVLDLSSTLKALRFRTTHFTPYYLLESYVDGGDGDDGGGSWDGDGGSSGGGGGGGCSVSPGSGGDVFGYLVPYMSLAAAMIALRVRDRRAARRRGCIHDR